MKAPDAGCAELGRAVTGPADAGAATAGAGVERVPAAPATVDPAVEAVETGREAPVEAAAALEGEEELIMHLERDQFVAETSRPVSRAKLSHRSVAALWALRAFAVVVSLMVIYTFVSQLH